MQAAESLTLDREIKADNRKVHGWLLYYHERNRKYEMQRDNILHGSPAPPDGLPRGTQTSDTTGRKAAQLADLGRWIELVEEVEQRLPWKMQILLRLRRECVYVVRRGRGRPSWIPYVQRRYAEELAKRLGKAEEDVYISSPAAFHDMWNRVVQYVTILAGKKGLL